MVVRANRRRLGKQFDGAVGGARSENPKIAGVETKPPVGLSAKVTVTPLSSTRVLSESGTGMTPPVVARSHQTVVRSFS